jgi:hypothetical protein
VRIRNQEDFFAGLLFIAFGGFFLAVGSQYPRGTADNMGPGYVPVALGFIVVVLGAVISAGSCARRATETRVGQVHWLLMLLVAGPVILFGLLLQYLGLIVSLLLIIGISSYASHEFSWKATVANATVLIALCVAVFVWGLRLPLPLWPSFVGR